MVESAFCWIKNMPMMVLHFNFFFPLDWMILYAFLACFFFSEGLAVLFLNFCAFQEWV